jgi:hypothetical protein
VEHRVTEIWIVSGQKNFAPLSNPTSSRWMLKLCYSQRACVKVCVIETALTYLSVVLYSAHVNAKGVIAEPTVCI